MRRSAAQSRPPAPQAPVTASHGRAFRTALLVVLWAMAPSQTLAWTETSVTTAGAEITVERDGQLRVVLTAELKVRGGWVTRFEIDGLPKDAQLDTQLPLSLTTADTSKTFEPVVESFQDGRIALFFKNRWQAPRRGHHLLRFAFTSRQALEQAVRPDRKHVRMAFQLPAWETGLHDVAIRVYAPLGTVPVNTDPLVTTSVKSSAERTQLIFHRHQLPRTVALDVVFDVPAMALRQAAAPDAGPKLHSLDRPFSPSPRSLPLLALGWLLAVCKLLVGGLRFRNSHLRRRFLVENLPIWTRLSAVVVAGLAGAHWAPQEPMAAITGMLLATVLVLERRAEAIRPPAALVAFNASRNDVSALRVRSLLERFDGSAMLDITTPSGGLVATSIALLCLAVVREFPSSAALTLTFSVMTCALFLSGTRRMQPQSAAEQTRRLLAALPALGVNKARLVLYRAAFGKPVQEARLALRVEHPAVGLKQASLVVGDLPWLDRHLQPLCWLVVVRSGSEADQSMAKALPGVNAIQTDDGKLTAYLSVADIQPTALARDSAQLTDWLTRTEPVFSVAA